LAARWRGKRQNGCMGVTSRAVVATPRADRFAKQLASHLGQKMAVTLVDGDQQLSFSAGKCLLSPTPEALVLTASAGDAVLLASVEDVIARHLVRFGAKDELTVEWQPLTEVAD
jgi:hypothetical protein